ncbi:MAG: YqaJ viral recombinase family protein [Anaerovoracaceae bacterium]
MQQAKIFAETTNMTEEEWLESRKKGIGGSDAGTICGLNKYKSPVELWLEKRSEIESEKAGESAYWGHMLEPVVAAEFSRQTGLEVAEHPYILQHPEYPFMLANVDRIIVGENKLLECKTASVYLKSKWEGDNIPDSYYCQGQHYCAVTGAEGVYFAVLIGGQSFHHKYMPRDEEFIARLIEIETRFWDMVESGERPEIDGCKTSTDILKKLFPVSEAEEIPLPVSAIELIKQFNEARDEIDIASFKKQTAENALKDLLGKAEKGTIDHYTVSWKSSAPRRTVDAKRLEKEKPDIYASYIKTGKPIRTFSIKGGELDG